MTVENCAVLAPVTGNHFVSCSDTMSKINHRLYRMTRKYFVDVKLHNPEAESTVKVYCLNNTWMLDKAVKYARAAYEKAVKEEKLKANIDRIYPMEEYRNAWEYLKEPRDKHGKVVIETGL